MYNSSEIETSIVKENELSFEEINNTANLINEVYLLTEKDFWPQDGQYQRTNMDEIRSFIKKQELIIATIAKEIVGAVHIYSLKEGICGFGMLVSSPKKRAIGIGSALMKSIEIWARTNNYKSIQLELLKPLDYKHPDKEFLTTWYTKLGYEMVAKTSYHDLYPEQASLLKVPCIFEIFQKNIIK
jgi:N-acetylglutamate synthase-like GNAT family acetyltransferase